MVVRLGQVDEVLKDSPRNAEARIAKARMLLVEGKAEEARDLARQGHSLN